jgi:hypothetical protein
VRRGRESSGILRTLSHWRTSGHGGLADGFLIEYLNPFAFEPMVDQPNQPSTIERIERALLLLAYFIELDGDVHVPMYAKFEAELEELKKRKTPRNVRGDCYRLTAAPAR